MNLRHLHLIQLGQALGLSYPTLDKMNELPSEMVAAWLNRQDNVFHQSGEPTWMGLVDALEKIGQAGIAKDIRESRCHNNSAASRQQAVSGPSQSPSRLDYVTGIIK